MTHARDKHSEAGEGHNSTASERQLRSLVDRILRLKEEQDALSDDIKDIYAEAKSNGYDKTGLGKLVAYLRKRDKDKAKLEEEETIFDLYLSAYDRASHTHAREGA